MEIESIRRACFDLSVNLMWEKNSITYDQIEDHMTELSSMTDDLYKIAMENLDCIEGLNANKEKLVMLVTSAINYVTYVHAIPPMRNHPVIWFDYTLRTLLEIARPNAILGPEQLKFLDELEKGIKESRNDAGKKN
jgi:hypothetical protein